MNVTIRLDYRPRLGPVRDQGFRPTCLAHASTTAHEHARGSTAALSPEYLHYFASGNDGTHAGVDFSTVSRALLDPGQPRRIARITWKNHRWHGHRPRTWHCIDDKAPRRSKVQMWSKRCWTPATLPFWESPRRMPLFSRTAVDHVPNRSDSRTSCGSGRRNRYDAHDAQLPHPQ